MSQFFVIAALMLALSLSFVLPPLLVKGRVRRGHAWALGLGMPLLACLLYALLGNPAGIAPQPSAPPQVEAMVQRLAERLKAQPDDAQGWRRLARSYETLRRFAPAADAYRHLLALEPDNADAMVDYAVVLGMTLDGKLAGPPEQLLHQALERDPKQVQALALAGSAAMERGDEVAAQAYWQHILALVPPDSALYRSMVQNIQKIQQSR